MQFFFIEGGPNDIISGKCSHGTPDDTSRNVIATGGIYKGRSNRKEAPHSYLHSTAAEAAVKATEYYLIDQSKKTTRINSLIFCTINNYHYVQ